MLSFKVQIQGVSKLILLEVGKSRCRFYFMLALFCVGSFVSARCRYIQRVGDVVYPGRNALAVMVKYIP